MTTTPPLFLVESLPSAGDIVVDGAEGHHAATVRRLQPGEPVRLTDGAGGLAEGTVAAVERSRLVVAVGSRTVVEPPRPRFVVVQAVPKGDRGELAVELMTEVGVDTIVPWQAARSVARWEGDRAERAVARWRSTAREAAKQARRPWLPAVTAPLRTREVCRLLTTAAGALVLHGGAAEPLGEVVLPPDGDLVVVVGPEGGLTDGELTAFRAAGARCARLGPSVLRTSSAGAAALAVLSVRLGRWA